MGAWVTRMHYVQPKPPSADKLLNADVSGSLIESIEDPEGRSMCMRVAVKEGLLTSIVAMSLTAGLIFWGRKRVGSATLKALLHYSPGVFFMITGTGFGTVVLMTELTIQDCLIQREAFLFDYRAKLERERALESVQNEA